MQRLGNIEVTLTAATKPISPFPIRVLMSVLTRNREQMFKRDSVIEREELSPFSYISNQRKIFFESNSEWLQIDGSLIIYCEIHSLMKNFV